MMINIIRPIDPTTYFLDRIPAAIEQIVGESHINIIEILANDNSYSDAINAISALPEESYIIFIGHGTKTELYGGANSSYPRKPLLNLRQMNLFSTMNLILFSCYSADLLISSRQNRNYSNSLGFGLLPTDMNEAEASSRLKKLNLDNSVIEDYRESIVDIFIESITFTLSRELTIESFFYNLKLFYNIKINDCVIKSNKRPLADLLFETNQDTQLI